jgi:hypothetical protein
MMRVPVLLLIAAAACGGGKPRSDPTPSNRAEPGSMPEPTADPTACAEGQEWLESGCGGGDQLPVDGCYTRCPMMDCETGFSCRVVIVNPCPGGGCDACSVDAQLCLPDG